MSTIQDGWRLVDGPLDTPEHVRPDRAAIQAVAVVFLMAVAVPFAFYSERLLVASNHIYRQIAWFCLIFGSVVAFLWVFHPAFKISLTPMVLPLSFVLILLSTAVIVIVYMKFTEELRRIHEEADGSGAHQESLSRVSLVGLAMLLGVANMRRRKIRTAFTLTTVMLLTFVALTFTSVQPHRKVSKYRTGRRPGDRIARVERRRGLRRGQDHDATVPERADLRPGGQSRQHFH